MAQKGASMGVKFQLVCAICALVLAGGCVSEASFRDMIEQVQEERAKSERLRAELNRLDGEKAALQDELATRQKGMEELLARVDDQADCDEDGSGHAGQEAGHVMGGRSDRLVETGIWP
jgi:outer membrane murein-binding lipoprotein Lpp